MFLLRPSGTPLTGHAGHPGTWLRLLSPASLSGVSGFLQAGRYSLERRHRPSDLRSFFRGYCPLRHSSRYEGIGVKIDI